MRNFLQISKALSDGTRVRALMALRDRELCLCQLIDLLDLAPSTVSKHLTILHQAGLVHRRKEGRWHFYRLATQDADPEVEKSLAWALSSLQDSAVVSQDQEALRAVCKKNLAELSACYKT